VTFSGIGERRRARLRETRLYLVTEGSLHGRDGAAVVAEALAGGVDIVQLRDKQATLEELRAAARSFRALCDAHGALFFVNDHPELALECGADGVHVGQEDESVAAVRAAVGPDVLVGVSTHSPAQIAAASAAGADLIGVGPVYETPTKPGRAAVGLELVRRASEAADLPFFAIGGIDATTAAHVVAAGTTRVAVVRAVRDADDPRAAAAKLRAALEAPVGAAR